MRVSHSRVPHPCATKYCYFVRLACLIHAASVRSEPGSNSPNKIILTSRSARSANFVLQDSILSQIFPIRYFLLRLLGFLQNLKIFSGSSHYSIFKDHSLYKTHGFLSAMVCNLACFFHLSNRFSDFFQTFFSTASARLPRQVRHGNEI